MWICRYFVFFTIFSFAGWVYESIYCTIKNKKWSNRGFLFGPVCPIYGVGAVAIMILSDLCRHQGVENVAWWKVFLIAFFGSIVLEYVTSWGLEKLFHAYWWDYSNVPLNIHGRVCLPASIGFGLAGLLVMYVIVPFAKNATGWMTPLMAEALSLFFMAVLAADAALTVSVLTNFQKNVELMEESLNRHMEQFVILVQEKTQEAGSLLAEESARFTRERMEMSLRRMGGLHRSALQRVQGFREYGSERSQRMKGSFLDTLRKRQGKKAAAGSSINNDRNSEEE